MPNGPNIFQMLLVLFPCLSFAPALFFTAIDWTINIMRIKPEICIGNFRFTDPLYTLTTQLFSPLSKLAGRVIYFADVFFKFLLMVDNGAPVAHKLMDRSLPKF